jgi:outer membrane protein OmpA-like peptidoglycan-associated protein
MKRYATAPRKPRGFDTWQIIYIDMMTNMMIFFVVLWAVSQRIQSHGVSDTTGTETTKMVNLPGDVLFPAGKAELSPEGKEVFHKLFANDAGTILDFDTGGLTRRQLVIHGHTDSDGTKEENLDLGYRRALAAYHEIAIYGGEVPDHVAICTHADNLPAQEVPALSGVLSIIDQNNVKAAKAKNRRITIEDKLVSKTPEAER